MIVFVRNIAPIVVSHTNNLFYDMAIEQIETIVSV